MKYMGSKATMLDGVLGEVLVAEAKNASRFVDLFTGSGSVSHHVAGAVDVPVVSVDQLRFAVVLAGSVTQRTATLDADSIFSRWVKRAASLAERHERLNKRIDGLLPPVNEVNVFDARRLASEEALPCFIWKDYAGYYFSPRQAFDLSIFYLTRPRSSPHAQAALAALIRVASRCSASPGHTAQPFRPTESLLPHISAAWRVPVAASLEFELASVGGRTARVRGRAVLGSAQSYLDRNARPGDLVFCDPPYSDAQYSRFYHVLEALARDGWPSVGGAGRAPMANERASSDFSRRPAAVPAMASLLSRAAKVGCTVMLTYPEGARSNNLSSSDIERMALPLFSLEVVRIPHRHSTLGGSASSVGGRAGRKELHELLFTLRPR